MGGLCLVHVSQHQNAKKKLVHIDVDNWESCQFCTLLFLLYLENGKTLSFLFFANFWIININSTNNVFNISCATFTEILLKDRFSRWF